MKKRYILICICILVSCLILGCKNDAIKIYHESKVSELMKDLQIQQKPSYQKSKSGVVIYRDESSSNKNANSMNFGPGEMDFGLRIK